MGEEMVSNYVSYGAPITPPFANGFESEADLAYFKVIDATMTVSLGA